MSLGVSQILVIALWTWWIKGQEGNRHISAVKRKCFMVNCLEGGCSPFSPTGSLELLGLRIGGCLITLLTVGERPARGKASISHRLNFIIKQFQMICCYIHKGLDPLLAFRTALILHGMP